MATPSSLADAEERRQQLTLEIQGIQAQLGDKQRTDESGRRLTAEEYWAWKKRAQHALNQKLDELRSLKTWIKERRPVYEEHVHPQSKIDTIVGHLAGLCTVLENLRAEDVDFDSEELNKIEAARLMLNSLDINKRESHDQDQADPATAAQRSG